MKSGERFVLSELRKLRLLCEYANRLVEDVGMEKQTFLGTLYGVDDNEYFKTLLYVTGVYPSFNKCDGVNFRVRQSLFKRFYEYNQKLHYITLLEPTDDDTHYSDFRYYVKKEDLDNCDSIAELKRILRAMIKDPDKHYNVSN